MWWQAGSVRKTRILRAFFAAALVGAEAISNPHPISRIHAHFHSRLLVRQLSSLVHLRTALYHAIPVSLLAYNAKTCSLPSHDGHVAGFRQKN